jgi:GTP-binding protein
MKLFHLIDEIIPQYRIQIDTSHLNRELQNILKRHQPPIQKGRELTIKYITQTGTSPPTFTMFVNSPGLMHFSYERFLKNQLSEVFGLKRTPIRLKFKRKSKD